MWFPQTWCVSALFLILLRSAPKRVDPVRGSRCYFGAVFRAGMMVPVLLKVEKRKMLLFATQTEGAMRGGSGRANESAAKADSATQKPVTSRKGTTALVTLQELGRVIRRSPVVER
jgi:hypothetical protein